MHISDEPIAGTVVRYAYLWSEESERGLKEGRKDRPAVLIIAKKAEDGSCIVIPITHQEPECESVGVEIPEELRKKLGLDDLRQWVIVSEGNNFVWPGPDLRIIPNVDPPTVIYGKVTKAFFKIVLANMQTLIKAKRLAVSHRR